VRYTIKLFFAIININTIADTLGNKHIPFIFNSHQYLMLYFWQLVSYANPFTHHFASCAANTAAMVRSRALARIMLLIEYQSVTPS